MFQSSSLQDNASQDVHRHPHGDGHVVPGAGRGRATRPQVHPGHRRAVTALKAFDNMFYKAGTAADTVEVEDVGPEAFQLFLHHAYGR